MTNLADKVIKANEHEEEVNTADNQKVDDVGIFLPGPDDTEKVWCEYLTARILYLNKRMYKYRGLLWLHDDIIKENKNTYYRMARYPKQITDPQCQYVWRRLRDLVPELDPDVIAVLPGLTFNMRTGELKDENVLTITPWEDEDE